MQAPVNELKKMGIYAECTQNSIIIQGGNPTGANIDTYNDHRMAMGFSVAGFKVPNLTINDSTCVNKSYPEFFKLFQ